MGVPKFFRFMSERYPCLNELVKEHQVSDFDNLYLDMNGIIHTCSHPDDSNPHFRITEEKILADIFHYISYLFQLIRPKVVFYLAIDGVAPRAKMNQQRGRRFRSAKEAVDLEKKAIEKGEKLPEGKRFDSNCITPGTVFMAKLHEQLRYFIKQKISTDSLWAKCRVVLSGHETPGEGEHKIMEYIRFLKAQPDHDPNTRHCLYGLDADLIMLGLCSHEQNFSLLREEVKFGKHAQRPNTPDESNFFLLHLSLLKDYMDQEFLPIKDKISFEYDLEKIVDDWVLMGFLVGNDFIPPLPHLHIHLNALPLLYETYKTVIVQLDGYINEGGILNLQRFEVFMKELSKLDRENFGDTYADLKYMESKTGRRLNAQERKSYKNHVVDDNETFGNLDGEECEWKPHSDDLKKLIQETEDLALSDDPEWEDYDERQEDSTDGEELFNHEFKQHRHEYYKTKLEYENVTCEVLQSQAECYVRAIQWVLHYYYQGCPSWSWYYPHHYAPFITDIIDFKNMDLNFDMGTPFRPFEQLLAVLPAASKELLPEPFQQLMTEKTSPIFSYYPENFETDLNGKRNEWEAIVLIPFIDEDQLLKAMEPCYQYLTEAERNRNVHGPMLIYDYTAQDLGMCPAPEYFPTIAACHARETRVLRSELEIPPEQVVRGALPNPKKYFFPGIPTLKTLPFTTHFTKAQVKVFEYPSRNESCILRLKYDNEKEPPIEDLADQLLGKVVWVNWPHLHRAKICSVSNESLRIKYTPENVSSTSLEDDKVKFVIREDYGSSKISEFDLDKRTIVHHNTRRLGIEVGEITTIIHAVSLKGFTHVFGTDGSIISGVDWCKVPSPYPLQAVIPKLDVSPLYSTRNLCIQDALPVGEKVFIKAKPYYGCLAEVRDASMLSETGRIQINVFVEPEPKIILETFDGGKYMSSHSAAAKCGMSSLLLSRVTGCIFVSKTHTVEKGRSVNVGIDVKYNKKNEELSGYAKRVDTKWLYSQKCIDLIVEYQEKFPELFENLSCKINQDTFTVEDLFGDAGLDKLNEVIEWLKNHPYKCSSVRSCGSVCLEPEEVIEISENITLQLPDIFSQRKTVMVKVKPHVLFKPELHNGALPPDPSCCDFKLYDRVVNVNARSTVPLGLKGTVVGISPCKVHADTANLSDKLNSDPLYHIIFDKPFIGGVSSDGITDNRLFKMQAFNLLNITQGRGDLPDVTISNTKFNTNGSNISDNLRNLRKDDGHNSAFASYNSIINKPPPVHQLPSMNQPPPLKQFSSMNQPPPMKQISPKKQNLPMMKQPANSVQQPPPFANDDQQTINLKSLLNIESKPNFVQPTPMFHHSHSTPNMPPFDAQKLLMPNWQHPLPHQAAPNTNNMPPNQYMFPGMQSFNNSHIPSSMYVNSNQPQVPRDLKPPYPNMFLNRDQSFPPNNMMPPQQQRWNVNQKQTVISSTNTVPSQFIPQQAVRQRNSAPSLGGKKPYRKSSNEKYPIQTSDVPVNENVPLSNKGIVTHSQITQIATKDDQKTGAKGKPRKSRLAANFGNSD